MVDVQFSWHGTARALAFLFGVKLFDVGSTKTSAVVHNSRFSVMLANFSEKTRTFRVITHPLLDRFICSFLTFAAISGSQAFCFFRVLSTPAFVALGSFIRIGFAPFAYCLRVFFRILALPLVSRISSALNKSWIGFHTVLSNAFDSDSCAYKTVPSANRAFGYVTPQTRFTRKISLFACCRGLKAFNYLHAPPMESPWVSNGMIKEIFQ